MRWVDALKQWNAGSGKWCIPRKGTEEYDAVRAIMGPKAEKAPKAPKELKGKAEKAPKEAKAPKASLQDMAAAVGVPMKTMKSAAADYYKRVDNAQDPERGLLIERMPAQLREGWEKHQEPAAPVVRRVLKKKPVMVAVPEAPAPAMKIPMERQRKAFSDSMAPKIAMKSETSASDVSDKKKLSNLITDLNYHHTAIQLRKNPYVYAVTVVGDPTDNVSSPTRREFRTLTDSQVQDLKQRASALKTQYPIRIHFPSGHTYSNDTRAFTGPAAPVVRRVIKKKPAMVAEKSEAAPAPTIQSGLRAYYAKMSGAERAQYDIAKQRRNRAAIAYYEKTYPFLKEEAKQRVNKP